MRKITLLPAVLLMAGMLSFPAGAAFDVKVEEAYNTAVQGQDALNGLDVSVKELTTSSLTNLASNKEVGLRVTGIRDEKLSARITVKADEDTSVSYYKDGYFYETASGEQVRSQMDRAQIWKRINSQIYLDMTSNYLKMLYSAPSGDGGTDYSFAATEETLGDYKAKLLDAYSEKHGAKIDSLQGTMKVDRDGHVLQRTISMVYSIGDESTGEEEIFHKSVTADFSQTGEVEVKIPDLSAYQELKPEQPAVTITALRRTAYVTADVNVRAFGSLDAAIIGGYSRGSGISQTGLTSDGWAQVQFNGAPGYVWGEYVSAVKPVFVTDSSGIMYATADVNIREDHGTDFGILGVLKRGQSIRITGTADNGWTRVDYLGSKGYIASNYLSRSEPVAENYVRSARVTGTVTDASYGSLTLAAADGEILFFNTQYASMQLSDGLETGDQVTVTYSGSDSPYTAQVVLNTTVHTAPSYQEPMESYTVDGVVTTYAGNRVEMVGSDGIYRSFDLSGASIEVQGGIHAGDYLMITWMSRTGTETDNIPAVAVS